MILGASEKKYAYFKSCERFFTACLLPNSDLHPGTVLIQAFLPGELSVNWSVSLSRGNIKIQFARKCISREEPKLCHSAIFLENDNLDCIKK